MAEVSIKESNPVEPSFIPQELQERYTHWKKNTKLLYDYLNSNSNKWPSLTCQFFPDVDTQNDSHRILLSSFTSSQLPEEESLNISQISTLKHLNWSSLNNFDMDEMEFKPDNNFTKFPPKNLSNELNIQFPNGDCNRARYLPQNPDLIAAGSSDGSIYIFDRTKYGSTTNRHSTTKQVYQAMLSDEKSAVQNIDELNEVLSLEWNQQKEGLLASAYSNGEVKVWDVTKFSRQNPIISKTVYSESFDPQGCNDVSWIPMHDSIFAACGESNNLSLFDLRVNKDTIKISENNHQGGINACKFNTKNGLLLASGDSEGNVFLWDIRKQEEVVRALSHGSSIATLEWNPNISTVIATAGQDDGLVKLWDAANGELAFVHGGHMLGINDISWDMHDPWLMCSVSKDNSVQIWKPAHNLIEVE